MNYSPGNPNRGKFVHNQPNTLEESRNLLRYPNTQRHFSMDTAEHSRYLTNHPYTKQTSTKLNAEKYSPYSSNYSYTRKYNDEESTVNLPYSSHYSDKEMNRHTFASERNKYSRLESHSSHYPHTERYTRSDVNEIDYTPYPSHFSHLGRNESSRLQTVEDSVFSSQKYGRTNLNKGDDLEYSPLYPHREQCMSRELATDKDQTYLPHNLHKRIKMDTEAVDVRDPTHPTYREKEKLTGIETVEDSASLPFRYTRKSMPYAAKNSAFVPLSHRDRNPPMELGNETNLHTELKTYNLDDQSLHNPQSGSGISIDQDDTNIKSNANNTHASSSSERRHSNTEEFNEADHKAYPPANKRMFYCDLCPSKFNRRYPLHLHMVDAHNLNDGKYIPSIKKKPPKVLWKEQCKPDPSFKCDICHKTFLKAKYFNKHKKGMGTIKCLPKEMMVKGKLELSKSLEEPASSAYNLNKNLPIELGVAEESRDLTDPQKKKNIPTEVSEVENPPNPTSYSQSKGEIPTELKKSVDATNISTTEIETTAAEISTGPSQSSNTSRYIPIELDAVIASSAIAEVENIVSRPVLPPLKCEHCNETFQRKSYLTHHNKIKHGIYRPQFNIPCPLCTKKFKKPDHLASHRASTHDNVHWKPQEKGRKRSKKNP